MPGPITTPPMRGVIFDLDGTLADTSRDLLAAANVALAPRGLPLLDPVIDRKVAGRGGRAMIRCSLEKAGRPIDAAPEVALTDALYPELLEAYAGALHVETRLYDDVETCLDELETEGWRLGVCTNKPEWLARPLLKSLGIHDRFGAILGADTLPVRKPDPEHIRETARRMGADPKACVMIGDTHTDLHAAQNAGIPCILTTFGFATELVDEMGAEGVVDSFAQLSTEISRLTGCA